MVNREVSYSYLTTNNYAILTNHAQTGGGHPSDSTEQFSGLSIAATSAMSSVVIAATASAIILGVRTRPVISNARPVDNIPCSRFSEATIRSEERR